MSVLVELRKKSIELPAPVKVKDALQQLNLPPETFHVLRNGVIVDDEEWLQNGEKVKLIPVISGG